MEILHQYQNGNYTVTLYADGTKEKMTEEDEFIATFPDNMDLKLTNYCDMDCPMCHENASKEGAHASLDAPFLATLHKGTEIAIGGGNPLSHPDLLSFLERMKAQGVVCNMTVNETHLLAHMALLEEWLDQKLIYGLGISLNRYAEETIAFAMAHPSVVLHIICGIASPTDIQKIAKKQLKILLLGYKKHGRGEVYYSDRVESRLNWMYRALPSIFGAFAVVSFDNLAIEQLDLRNRLKPEVFSSCYMGGDGEASMYVDLVKGEFGLSSISAERYPLLPSAQEMLAYLHQTQ